MNILITGATGFVGSHLSDLLDGEGHKVYSLIRNVNKAIEFNVKGEYIEGSLVSEGPISWIDKLPKNLDVVIHTAGIVHAKDKKEFEKINTLSTINLYSKLQERYKDLHFVFVSSLAAGGPSTDGIIKKENHKNEPVSAYGHSKLNAESYLENNKPNSWTLSCIRPPMIIGPRDPAVLDVFKMVNSGLVIGPGRNFLHKKYSFICVKDLTSMINEVIKQKAEGVFYASHNEIITFENLINTMAKKLEKRKVFKLAVPDTVLKTVASFSKFVPGTDRITKDKVNELIQDAWICDPSKILDSIDFTPNWDLEDTVTITIEDYKSRGWL